MYMVIYAKLHRLDLLIQRYSSLSVCLASVQCGSVEAVRLVCKCHVQLILFLKKRILTYDSPLSDPSLHIQTS